MEQGKFKFKRKKEKNRVTNLMMLIFRVAFNVKYNKIKKKKVLISICPLMVLNHGLLGLEDFTDYR